jgi:hypothetical protein
VLLVCPVTVVVVVADSVVSVVSPSPQAVMASAIKPVIARSLMFIVCLISRNLDDEHGSAVPGIGSIAGGDI